MENIEADLYISLLSVALLHESSNLFNIGLVYNCWAGQEVVSLD